MAIHTDLPIYKLAYELLSMTTDLIKNMPRDYRVAIGGTLREECVELTVLVFRANSARDKTPHLDKLLERVQVTELLFRLSRDKRLISTGQYAKAIAITDKIGRQANGWRKHSASSPVA